MNILITGVAGFIGHNLAQKLLDQGHIIFGVDNFSTGQREKILAFKKHKKFQFWEDDISNDSFWKQLTKKIDRCDQVFHLACPTGVPYCVTLSKEMLLTSSSGTKNAVEFAHQKNAAFLFTSSSEIYGDPLVFPQTENYWGNVDPIGLRSPYEEGKRFAESFLRSYGQQNKTRIVIARLFNTYGPDMSREETRVIPRMIGQALGNKPITVYNNGDQTRTFCYIDDLLIGLEILMKKGKRGEVYNIGSIDEITMNELVLMIKKLIRSNSDIIKKEMTIPDHRRRLPDISKIESLGWRQKISLTEGLQKTIAYFQ